MEVSIISDLINYTVDLINKSYFITRNQVDCHYDNKGKLKVVFYGRTSCNPDNLLLDLKKDKFCIEDTFEFRIIGVNKIPSVYFEMDYKKYSRIYKIKNL
jgi:hypothetical protein